MADPFPVGTRVRVQDDARSYINGRIGTVGTCPTGRNVGAPDDVVVDLDSPYPGFKDRDYHFDPKNLTILEDTDG